MLFKLVPESFSYLINLIRTIRIQIGRNYWELETYMQEKLEKAILLFVIHISKIFRYFKIN
jgi:hypothetical protein